MPTEHDITIHFSSWEHLNMTVTSHDVCKGSVECVEWPLAAVCNRKYNHYWSRSSILFEVPRISRPFAIYHGLVLNVDADHTLVTTLSISTLDTHHHSKFQRERGYFLEHFKDCKSSWNHGKGGYFFSQSLWNHQIRSFIWIGKGISHDVNYLLYKIGAI